MQPCWKSSSWVARRCSDAMWREQPVTPWHKHPQTAECAPLLDRLSRLLTVKNFNEWCQLQCTVFNKSVHPSVELEMGYVSAMNQYCYLICEIGNNVLSLWLSWSEARIMVTPESCQHSLVLFMAMYLFIAWHHATPGNQIHISVYSIPCYQVWMIMCMCSALVLEEVL